MVSAKLGKSGRGSGSVNLGSRAIVIRADGTRSFFDHQPTLEECQAIVGGYIEILVLGDGSQLVIDEEGKIKGKPVNTNATYLAGKVIAGNVLHLTRGMKLK